jgi:hypothetical protein
MTSTLRNSILFSSATIGLIACGAAKDALDGEGQTSYCEAVCDWAVDCSGDESALDACLTATRAADAGCADAESGDLDPATSTLVEDCVATVESDSCDGLTGSIEAQGSATPSTECITSEGTAATETYDAARTAVQPSGAEFCDDLGETICSHVVDCLVGENSELVSDTLQAACVDGPISGIVTSCNAVDLEVGYGTDANPNRLSANVCSNTLDGLSDSCDVFTADAWPPECVGSVVEASELASVVDQLITLAADNGVELP